MYYVALIWDAKNEKKSQAAARLLWNLRSRSPKWRIAADQPGLAVCCKPRPESRLDNFYLLSNGRGVVLGKLFRRRDGEFTSTEDVVSSPVPTESEASAIVRDRGTGLIEEFWGRYAAFLHDPLSGRTTVLRDPNGGMHCQWTSISDIDVYFVRLDDVAHAAPLNLSVDPVYIASYLLYSTTDVRQTPFKEVQTVLPGERIDHIDGRRSHDFAWSAISIAQQGVIEDEVVAVQRLRQTVRMCVHAWASCFDGIWHSLSGGLDSSIVAACLADAPTKPHVTCRNLFFDGPSSDERFFARLVAKHTGFELVEQEARSHFDAELMRTSIRSLFPVCWPADTLADQAENVELLARGYSAEFRGHGGDELFVRGGSLPVAVDYAWQHGLSRKVLAYALNDAVLMSASLWNILRWVYRYGVRRKPWNMRQILPADHMSLMKADMRNHIRRNEPYSNPLFKGRRALPPGKLEHAYLLTYGACTSFDPLLPDSGPARLSPLQSQPLTELSLRIPLYTHQADGRDRAIARRAFQHDLPADVINRKSKSYGTQRYRVIVEANMPLVREMLTDGFLVQEGILDRAKVAEALSPRISRSPAQILEICDYMTFEVWARAWDRHTTKADLQHAYASAHAQGAGT